MTHQETVVWLGGYRRSLLEERWLRERIAQTRARAEATTKALRADPAPGGSRGDRISACIEQLAAYQEQLAARIETSERLRAEIEGMIRAVPGALQRQVLEARYIDGEPWWRIAGRLYISERWAKELHRRGVESISERVHASSPPAALK